MVRDEAALELAFLVHVVEMVVRADDVTTDKEQAFLERVFPQQALREHGFVDEAGHRTEALEEAAVEALDVLPKTLDHHRKRALLARAFDAAVVDDALRLGEGSVVLMASRLLGVSDQDFDAFLGTRAEARGVTVEMLDEAEA